MSKKILVVDDSTTIRQQVGLVLVPAGFQVVEAVDGADGKAKLGSEAGISLVICDVNMPNMNGIEMLEAIKAEGKFTSVPVVMLTTEGSPDLIAKAKAAGAKGWIVKPFKPEMLLAAVKKLAS